jgi:hypothetical protein
MNWRDDPKRGRLKMAGLLAIPLLLAILCALALLLGKGGETAVGWVLFAQFMSKSMDEFSRLNSDVWSQLPHYAEASFISSLSYASTDPLQPEPNLSAWYYISSDTPSQICAFFASAMSAQGWQTQDSDCSTEHSKVFLFSKGYACVEIRVQPWDEEGVALTGYEPRSPDGAPIAWFRVSVWHKLDAIPGAPKPRDPSLFECVPRRDRY